MAEKSLQDRIAAEFPNQRIRPWVMTAVIDGDFSNLIGALDSKILSIEIEKPHVFAPKLSFAEKLEISSERRSNNEQRGLKAVLEEGKSVNEDYRRLTALKDELLFFQGAFALIRESFGNQEDITTSFLIAIQGKGIEDLSDELKGNTIDALQESLRGAAQFKVSMLPRSQEGTLQLRDFFAASNEGRKLLKIADALDGLKVVASRN